MSHIYLLALSNNDKFCKAVRSNRTSTALKVARIVYDETEYGLTVQEVVQTVAEAINYCLSAQD